MPDIGEIYGGWDPNEKADYLDEKNNCCGQTMKVWLIICNAILVVLALAAFSIGIWVQSMPGFTWTAGSVGVGLILIGVFLILVAVLGCFAAWKNIKCLMAIYATLLFIFFIAELAALVVAYAATGVAVDVMAKSWDGLTDDHKAGVGAYFGCCAIENAEGLKQYGQSGDDSNPTTYTTCKADDPMLAGNGGESDPDDVTTHTQATGICTIFGLDYRKVGDDKVTHVSFAKYKEDFLTKGECTCEGDDCDDDGMTTCGTYNRGEEKCTETDDGSVRNDLNGKPCIWKAPEGAACVRSAEQIKANRSPQQDEEGKPKESMIPEVCTCKLPKSHPYDSKKNPDFQACRQKIGAIPACADKTTAAPFPFVVGKQDEWVNVSGSWNDGTWAPEQPARSPILAPVAACYAKFEQFMSDNLITALIIIGVIFLYQFIQLVFAMLLCCG